MLRSAFKPNWCITLKNKVVSKIKKLSYFQSDKDGTELTVNIRFFKTFPEGELI